MLPSIGGPAEASTVKKLRSKPVGDMHAGAMKGPDRSDNRIPRLVSCLADPSRYRMLSLLLEGDYCVSELAGRVGLSQSCTTRHLQILQRAGVLTRTRAGKRVMFRLREGDAELSRLIELLILRRPLVTNEAPARSDAAKAVVATPTAPRSRGGSRDAGQRRAGGRPSDAVTISLPTGGLVASDAPAASDSVVPPPDVAEPLFK